MGKDDILGGHMEAIYYEAALLVQREHVVQFRETSEARVDLP